MDKKYAKEIRNIIFMLRAGGARVPYRYPHLALAEQLTLAEQFALAEQFTPGNQLDDR